MEIKMKPAVRGAGYRRMQCPYEKCMYNSNTWCRITTYQRLDLMDGHPRADGIPECFREKEEDEVKKK